jgi:hypothetical protein
VLNAVGRAALNSPARALAQRRLVIPAMRRLDGGLEGCRVLELGCGGGHGRQLILDVLSAEFIDTTDTDPVIARRAERRLGRRAHVPIGDMVDIGAEAQSYDAVVDMGVRCISSRVGAMRSEKGAGRCSSRHDAELTTQQRCAYGRTRPSDTQLDRRQCVPIR